MLLLFKVLNVSFTKRYWLQLQMCVCTTGGTQRAERVKCLAIKKTELCDVEGLTLSLRSQQHMSLKKWPSWQLFFSVCLKPNPVPWYYWCCAPYLFWTSPKFRCNHPHWRLISLRSKSLCLWCNFLQRFLPSDVVAWNDNVTGSGRSKIQAFITCRTHVVSTKQTLFNLHLTNIFSTLEGRAIMLGRNVIAKLGKKLLSPT